MKTELIEAAHPSMPEDTKINWPILAKFIAIDRFTDVKSFVVLFSDFNKGVVLTPGHSNFEVGRIWDNWINVFEKKSWEILPPGTQIKLTQESVFK